MDCSSAPDTTKERSGNLKRPLRTAQRFTCTAPSINTNQHCELAGFLPQDYQYHVCRYRALSQSSDDHESFEATVRMSLKSKAEIVVWLRSMSVTWRVAHTRPTKGHRIIFKADYRCQHNTKPRDKVKASRVSKNTDCPAKLKVTLVRTEISRGQRSRNMDPHIPEYPTLVVITNVHNHNIHVAAPDVTPATADTPQAGFDSEGWSSMISELSVIGQSAVFQQAAAAMMKTFHKIKRSPSMLQAAMHMFGHSGANGVTSHRARTLPQAGQSSSSARRKVKLRGRRQATTVRLKTAEDQSDPHTVSQAVEQ